MENWSEIYSIEKEIRNGFLIGRRRITQSEVYQMKDLFEQIEEAVARIKCLLRNSEACGSIRRGTEEEIVYLLFIYESLKEMVRGNEDLRDRFISDIARAERMIGNIPERIANSPAVLNRDLSQARQL